MVNMVLTGDGWSTADFRLLQQNRHPLRMSLKLS
jgi:hypothetical protein